jgi:hypothetical protein
MKFGHASRRGFEFEHVALGSAFKNGTIERDRRAHRPFPLFNFRTMQEHFLQQSCQAIVTVAQQSAQFQSRPQYALRIGMISVSAIGPPVFDPPTGVRGSTILRKSLDLLNKSTAALCDFAAEDFVCTPLCGDCKQRIDENNGEALPIN